MIVSWDISCRSREEGGLNIKHLRTLNRSLLCKLAFKLVVVDSFGFAFLHRRFLRMCAICRPFVLGSTIWATIKNSYRVV